MKHKRLISVLLAFIMLLAIPVGVFAEDPAPKSAYTIAFDAGDGTGTMVDITTDDNGKFTLPDNGFTAPAGKQFKAWEVNNAEEQPGVEITVTANTTVKALWGDKVPAVDKVTVSFDKNGGTGNMASKEVEKSSEYTLPKCEFTAPAGKEFDAWEVAGARKDVGDKITVNADTTVKALWKDKAPVVDKVTVSFDKNGGTGNMASKEVEKSSEYTLPKCEFTAPAGKEFDAWEVAGARKDVGDKITVNADTTVKALWKDKAPVVDKVTVSFNTNGGTSVKSQTVNKGEKINTPTSPTKTGYTFAGWYEDTKFVDRVTFPLKVDKDITLYAKWTKDTTPSHKENLYIRDTYISGNYVYGYVEDEDDYRVKGATVTAYERYGDNDKIDSDTTDSNGRFKVWIGNRHYSNNHYDRDYDYYYDGYYFNSSAVYYSNGDPYINTSSGRIYLPSNWRTNSKYKTSRRYYDYDFYLVAEKSGYYDSSKVYFDDDDYHNGNNWNGRYSVSPTIKEAYAGERTVKGSAGDYADIDVYDDDGYKLGSTTADRDGDFTVYLNRDLKYGEKIKVEAKDGSRYTSSTTYTVKYKNEDTSEVINFIRPAYIKGYPDGTFKPNKTVTRAEAVKMFVVLLNNGKDVSGSHNASFKDANNGWYTNVINYAVDNGYIKGYSDGTFKPDNEITRAEFAQMISKYVDKGYPGSTNFKDVKGHWASDAISALYGNKNIKGYPDGTFKPNSKLTRAEAVTILNSVFGRDTRANSLYNIKTSGLKTFSDVNKGFWAYYEILDSANYHTTAKIGTADGFEVWK